MVRDKALIYAASISVFARILRDFFSLFHSYSLYLFLFF